MHLCYFFSYLYKYLNRYWANELDIFITTSTKTNIFTVMQLKKHSYDISTTISKVIRPSLHYQDMKGPMQIKSGKCYSLMLPCLKINCINMSSKFHLSKWKTYFSQFIDKLFKIEEVEYLIHYVKFNMWSALFYVNFLCFPIIFSFWFFSRLGSVWEEIV